VEFVRGAELHRPDHGMDLPPYAPITEQSPAQLEQEIRKAVAIAARSDVAIVVVGEHENMSGENSSRASFDLPGSQEQMLEAVASAGKPVVLVLLSGRPLNINWASKHVAAILQAWYPGSEGGNAVSDVLFGDVNPSGKLPITWPRSAGQEPVYYAHNLTHFLETSPSFISRYWDQPSSQLYPFGFGLSYSQFDYSNLRLDKNVITKNEALHASIDVTNSGAVDGEDIVQLYVHQQAGTASRPVKQLKGFQKVRLAPGEKQTVRFTLRTEDVGYWNPQSRCWIVEHEAFDVWIGGDSSATAHGTFRIKP
jgi:beta-glucosidase